MKVQSTNAQSLADHLFPKSFSEALRYLRKRAHLTQDELGRSVGYSREQIARLENGSRLPDLAVVAALFVPALDIQHQPKQPEKTAAPAPAEKKPADAKPADKK